MCNEALLDENDERQKEFIELLDYNIYSKDKLIGYLNESGFSKVEIFIEQSKDLFTNDDATWFCVIAQK